MANNLAKVEQFKGFLNDKTIRAQLKNSLKEKAGAFMSSMIDLYTTDTNLQNYEPEAVAMECMKAAVLDLPLVKSLGFAYIVPYNGKPTFTIGYKGLLQLAQRTGKYKTINSGVVYDGEFLGEDKLSGMLDLSGTKQSDEVTGYFAYFKLLNGYEKVMYMSKEDMLAYADKYSPSYHAGRTGKSPWYTEFDKMAQKTLLRKLISTYGPMSVEMQKAVLTDDVGKTPKQKIKEEANQDIIDITSDVQVNTDTGEVVEPPATTPVPEQNDMPFDISMFE